MTIPFFQDVLTTATAASLYLILPFTQNFQSLPDSIHRNISHINQNAYNRDLARWCPTGLVASPSHPANAACPCIVH